MLLTVDSINLVLYRFNSVLDTCHVDRRAVLRECYVESNPVQRHVIPLPSRIL